MIRLLRLTLLCLTLAALPAGAQVTYRSVATATAQNMPSTIIQFRGVGSLASASSGSVTPGYPSGWAVNDLLLCLVETKDNVAVSMPAGWTQLLASTSGASHQAKVFWKRAASGDDTTPTITHSGGNSIIARIVGFSNVVTSGSPFEGTASFTNSVSDLNTEAAAITTATAGALLVFTAHIADNGSSIDNTNAPAGWVETFASSTSRGSDSSIEAWYTMPMSVGAQSAVTMPRTGTAAISSGGIMALTPATAGLPGLTINKPSGSVTNDALLAGLSFSPDKTLVSPPAGWTLLRRTEQSSGNPSVLLTYWKVAGASESSSYTWNYWGAQPDATGVSNDGAIGSVLAFSGASTTAPVATDAGQATASSTSHAAPTVTTTQTNDMLVTFHELASSRTWTPPTGMTEVADIASITPNNSSGVSLEANYQTIAAAGATGAKTATVGGSSDTGATASVVLSQLTCFSDNFTGSNGASPGANWSVGNMTQGGSAFGNPQIQSNRLRLTDNSGSVATWATLNKLFPAAGNKIVVTFDHFAYNGSAADGVGVILSDAATAPVAGAFGGSLGYAQKSNPGSDCTTSGGCPGFHGGWVGIALDEFGNFSNNSEGRSGGSAPGQRADSVSIRGAGSGQTGYSYITGTATLATGIDNAASTSAAPGYRYRIIIDHTNNTNAMTSVERDTGSGYSYLISPFDVKNSSYGQPAVPTNWNLTFTGSTGGSTNIHEIDNLTVCSVAQATPAFHHLRLLHDGTGTPGVAESVTVEACADASCTSLYLGTVAATLSFGASTDATWTPASVSFAGGQLSVVLNKATAGTITLAATATSPTTVNATDCYNGTSLSCSFAFGTMNFDVVEAGGSSGGRLYTKLANVAFPGGLDVLAVSGGILNTSYAGTVLVSLVNPAAASGNCSDSSAGLTSEQSVAFTAGTGRKNFSFTSVYANAAANVKVRVRDTAQGITACSSDSFTIRPQSFAVTTAGIGVTGCSSNCIKAGENFTITATPSQTTGYSGTPLLAAGAFTETGTPAGTLTQAWTNASGVATGTLDYSEVASYSLSATDTVYDDTFVTNSGDLAGGDCVSASSSNTATAGKYGCRIGGSAALSGRTIPYQFALSSPVLTPGCGASSTYYGQQLSTSFTLTAMEKGGGVTTKYDGATRLPIAWSAASAATGLRFSATTLTAGSTLGAGTSTISGSWAGGSVNVTAYHVASRVAAAPSVPTLAAVIATTPVDSDAVTIASSGALGSGDFYYGRLWLGNAFGSDRANLSIPYEFQYWNGNAFIKNGTDTCSTFSSANLGLGNYQGTITSTNMGVAKFSVGANGGGGGTISVSAPTSAAAGSVDVVPNLGSSGSPGDCGSIGGGTSLTMPYLSGKWCGSSYDRNPTARATFGVYGSSLRKGPIYIREAY